jgi:hypothetical protein
MKARGRLYQTSQGRPLTESGLMSPKSIEVYNTTEDNLTITHDDLQKQINAAFANAQTIAGRGARTAAGVATELTKEGEETTRDVPKPTPGGLRKAYEDTHKAGENIIPYHLPKGWNVKEWFGVDPGAKLIEMAPGIFKPREE